MPKNTPQRRIDTRRRNQATSISGVTLSGPAGVTDHGALQGLADDDHSQYLLADGTRTLAGNLAVASGITIDGIDLSAHAANADAHHPRVHAIVGGDHTASGLTAGWTIRATDATTFAWAQLQHGDLGGVSANQHHNQVHAITGADHTVSGASWDVIALTATNTLGVRTPLADTTAGVLEALLKSNASGGLELVYLDTPEVRNNAGSVTLNPTGTAVLPTGTITKDLGDYNRKWRTLYAAELYVETLVAQDVISTIGGRITVAPTSTLIADLSSGGTTIDVKHNSFVVNEYLYMATAPGGVAQVEVLRITAGPTTITGGYRYTVTRNVDGSGVNSWVAGDAVASLGNAAGDGLIELTATSTLRNHLGPSIVTYARNSTATWNALTPTTVQGNLRSFVDYGADEFGFALGNDLTLTPTTGFSGMTADRTNGLRLFNVDFRLYSGSTQYLIADATYGLRVQGNNTAALNSQRGITFLDTAAQIGGLWSYFASGGQIWTEMQAGYSSSARQSTVLITALGTGNRGVSLNAGAANVTVSSDTILGTTVDLIATTVRANGNTMWHAGNDGSGSTLDADTVDTYHAASFALLSGATFTGPVIISRANAGWQQTDGNVDLRSYITGGVGFVGTISNHPLGFYTNGSGSLMEIQTNGTVRFGNTSDLYSAKIQTNGNIHAQGAITSELYLQVATASTPAAATGFARMWFDGTNIKVILPGGTTRTLNWT